VRPEVAGKPERPLLDETVRRVGGQRPLMVGDRLDTDIEGARNAGYDSLLVMTGVTDLGQLVGIPAGHRPTYVAADLGGLLEAHERPVELQDGVEVGGWHAAVAAGRLSVSGSGSPGDWWRAVTAAGWAALDDGGVPVDTDDLDPPRP
jgi:hypothetical protein